MDQAQKSKIKRYGIIAVSVIILGVLANYVFSHGFIKITINSDGKHTIRLYDANELVVNQFEVEGNSSKRIWLETGHFTVEATAERSSSISPATINSLTTTEVELETSPQKAVSKIVSDTAGCHTVEKRTTYSFGCLSAQPVYAHELNNSLQSRSVVLDNNTSVRRFAYADGVLELNQRGSVLAIDYINLTTDKRTTLSDEGFDIVQVAINESEDLFAVIGTVNSTKQRRVIFFDGTKEVGSGYEFPSEVVDNIFASHHTSLNNGVLIDYFGLSSVSPDSDEEEEQTKNYRGGTITTINISDQTVQSFEVPVSLRLDSVYAINANQLIGYSDDGGMVEVILEGGEIKAVEMYDNSVLPLALTGNELYLLFNNGLYRHDFALWDTKLVFEENNVTVSDVNIANGKVFFSGFIDDAGTSQYFNGYELLSEPATYPRLEEALPYSRAELPIRSMDYFGETIYVQLLIETLGINRNTGKVFYSQSEFDQKESIVLSRLMADGYTSEDYNIVITE